MLRFVFSIIGMLIAYPVISQKISFRYDEAGNRINRFAEIALPVRLVYFGVKTEENTATIRWKTAGEENISYFDIERSSDGLSWHRIAEVHSQLHEDALLSDYVHVDTDPPPGRNLYRLKIVEEDGSLAYSRLESVFLNSELRVYPNPAKDYLQVESPFKIAVSYEIVAPDGRVVLRGMLGHENRVDLGTLSPALYTIRFKLASGETFIRRVVKE